MVLRPEAGLGNDHATVLGDMLKIMLPSSAGVLQ